MPPLLALGLLLSPQETPTPKAVSPTLEASFTGEVVSAIEPGLSKGNTYQGRISVTAELSTEEAGWWHGGTFFGEIIHLHGGNPTPAFVGAVQTVSNIEGESTSRLMQLWYQHELDDKGSSLLLGQHDMNSECAASDHGCLFLNSSFGLQPDISVNAPVSTYPMGALGARLAWAPGGDCFLRFSLYDGDPGSLANNPRGTRWKLSAKEGVMIFSEFLWQPAPSESGKTLVRNLRLGTWRHTAEFEDVRQKTARGDFRMHPENYGIFSGGDFALLEYDEGGIFAFFQGGWAPEDRNEIESYFSLGLTGRGLLPGRPNDSLGLAIGRADISSDLRKATGRLAHETLVELTYRAEISPAFSIQPDFQWIIHPGSDPRISNSGVAMLRFELTF